MNRLVILRDLGIHILLWNKECSCNVLAWFDLWQVTYANQGNAESDPQIEWKFEQTLMLSYINHLISNLVSR